MATRWVTETAPGHSQRYIARFRQMAAEGRDLDGEARFLDAMLSRGSRVLDAGCGPGRVGAALAARGHTVVGVDADAELIAAAQEDHPGPHWIVADISEFDLSAQGEAPFDAAILAGNVMPYVEPGTEAKVLTRVGAHVKPDGVVVIGFSTDRGYSLEAMDAHTEAAGLKLESRFATWDLRPFHPGGDYAVTVLRVPR
jgi:2-polyprenyl-3-methyl-5-hydroxy-6-metoxy-1,4-benzoquinol methylase